MLESSNKTRSLWGVGHQVKSTTAHQAASAALLRLMLLSRVGEEGLLATGRGDSGGKQATKGKVLDDDGVAFMWSFELWEGECLDIPARHFRAFRKQPPTRQKEE